MNKPQSLFKTCLTLLLTLWLGGCAIAGDKSMPYKAWHLGFEAPAYMEVWIETADAVDIRERGFKRAMSGIAAVQTPPNNAGNPKGWPERPAGGKGKYIIGADLPRLIYVRWQSLVEPQTYEAYIEIDEPTRAIMRKGEKAYCALNGKWITDHRRFLTVGLAPGGIAKIWVQGPCLSAIEVGRITAEIVPEGPYGGKSDGEYYFLSDESKAYIDQHEVPYGSW